MHIHLSVSVFTRLLIIALVVLATVGCASAFAGNQTPTAPVSVTEVASGEASSTIESDDSAVDNFLAQLDERSITVAGSALLDYGRIEHCLNVPGRSYEVASGERVHIFPYQDESAAQLAAEKVPADADCGPIDWVVDVRYYQCGELIVFLTSQEADVLNRLVDLCGQPFAVGKYRFPPGSDVEG